MEYPIKDEHRWQYVKYPVEVTESLLIRCKADQLPCGRWLEIGQWIGVDIVNNGYSIPPVAIGMDQESASKACNIHNKYIGLTTEQSVDIISQSFNGTLEVTEPVTRKWREK